MLGDILRNSSINSLLLVGMYARPVRTTRVRIGLLGLTNHNQTTTCPCMPCTKESWKIPGTCQLAKSWRAYALSPLVAIPGWYHIIFCRFLSSRRAFVDTRATKYLVKEGLVVQQVCCCRCRSPFFCARVWWYVFGAIQASHKKKLCKDVTTEGQDSTV